MRLGRLLIKIGCALLLLATANFFPSGAQARVCEGQIAIESADPALPASTLALPDSPTLGLQSLPLEVPTWNLTDQDSSTADAPPKPAPAADKKRNLKVNPLTGLVTAAGSDYQPLTGEERWKLYWKMNYLSVGAYFGPFFDALLLDQATASPAQWGGGLKGYGRRVASRTATAMLQGTVQAPLAALLHEDVRYVASPQNGFKPRLWHAIKYSVLTYNSHGHPTVNFANLGAYYASTAVSTLWIPGRYNPLSYTVSNSSEQIVLTMPINILQEFWPEVRHYVFRRH